MEAAYAVAVDARGMIYLTGRSNRDVPEALRAQLPHDAYDILAMKLAPDGAVRWHHTFGTHVWRGDKLPADEGYDIALDARGRPVIVGETYGKLHGKRNRGAPSGFVMALSKKGEHRWTRLSEDRNAYQSVTRQGRSLVISGVGPTTRKGTFVRYSAAGKQLDVKHYSDQVAHTGDKDYIAFERVVVAGDRTWLVGQRRELSRRDNAWRVVGMSWARAGRSGDLQSRVRTRGLGDRASVLDATVNARGALCVAGTDELRGFVRCVDDSGRELLSVSLGSSHRVAGSARAPGRRHPRKRLPTPESFTLRR